MWCSDVIIMPSPYCVDCPRSPHTDSMDIGRSARVSRAFTPWTAQSSCGALYRPRRAKSSANRRHSFGMARASTSAKLASAAVVASATAAGVALATGTCNCVRPPRLPHAPLQEKSHLASRCRAASRGSSARNSTVRSASGMRPSPAIKTLDASRRRESASRSTRATPADGRSAHSVFAAMMSALPLWSTMTGNPSR